jgi:signal peptidase I
MKSLALLLVAGTLLTSCRAEQRRQMASSMEPTVRRGEVVEVDSFAYSTSAPQRWDVILFESPIGEGEWIARIVGLPGETVDWDSTGLRINGTRVIAPPHLGLAPYVPRKEGPNPKGKTWIDFPYIVPVDGYFVMGDNVGNALDSHYWGALETSKIRGKVIGK